MTRDSMVEISNTTSPPVTTSTIVNHVRYPDYKQADAGTCLKFNQSDPFHIGDKYGGIPLNLLTNTIGWAILLVILLAFLCHSFKNIFSRFCFL